MTYQLPGKENKQKTERKREEIQQNPTLKTFQTFKAQVPQILMSHLTTPH